MRVDQDSYRKAFLSYIRKGTPVAWSLKQDHPTTHYMWRTRHDGKVRSSHALNDGQVFEWSDPPITGNPGEDFGCRCTAEPFDPAGAEFITITFEDVADKGQPWSSADFVDHYFHGRGRAVTVRETGHLEQIVARYFELAHQSLKTNIAEVAREQRDGEFADVFFNSYKMTWVVFSIGHTVIGGSFSGHCTTTEGWLHVAGVMDFYLRDAFADPVDLGIDVIDPEETVTENLLRPLEDWVRGTGHLPPPGHRGPGCTGAIPIR